MITAVDANIILDVLAGSPKDMETADTALLAAKRDGDLTLSAVAYAEIAARFRSKVKADDFFSLLGCTVQPIDQAAAFLAGQFFYDYKKRGGKRNRILADFLIAAHAQLYADRILTRDNRFFGIQFPKLKAITSEELS